MKRLLLSSIGVFLFGGMMSFAQQTFEWVSGYQGANDVFGQNVATDDVGNVYSVGFFFGTADFDPGPGTFNLTSPGQNDIYITKLDVNGNLIWAHRFGNADRNRGNNVAVDSQGNVYITGYFENTVDFDPSSVTRNLTSVNVIDVFVLKLDSDGNFLWVRQFGSTIISEGLDVKVDNNDDVLIGGYFRGDCDFDMAGSGFLLTSSDPGNRDAFLTKLSSTGDFVWTKQQGGVVDGRTEAISIDAANNIYGTGFFEGTWDFDLIDNPGVQLESSNGSRDIYVYKLDENGVFQWSGSAGDIGDDRGNGISINVNGNLFITGQFENTVDFDPSAGISPATSAGAADSYIWSLDENGVFNWVNNIGGPTNDFGLDMSKDPAGNAYLTGYFTGTAAFDGTTNLTSVGGNDIYVAKYDELGALDWVQQLGDVDSDIGFGIHVSDNWDVHSTGYFRQDCDFDPTGTNTSLTSLGLSDAYVHKLSQTCTAATITNVDALSTMLCPGIVDSTRVYVDGTLNDATDWAWYQDGCGTTFLGYGDSLTVRPAVTTTYFVRPEGGCGTPPPCQSVTVNVDNTPPSIVLITPITVNTDPGTCFYPTDSLTPPTVTDVDCGVDTVYHDAGVLLLTGTTTVTWTAVDVNGNTSTETQDVTVEDNENPNITAPGDLTVSADVNCEAVGVALGTHTATDNCTVDTVFNDAPATFPLGLTVVTWTVEDISGNTNTDTQNVTVVDDTDPTIVGLPADIVVNNDPGVCEAVVNWVAPTANDNCPGAVINQTGGLASGSSFPEGVSTIEYTATDGAGNETIESFTVTVVDNENPTVTAPADILVSADNNCQANPGLGTATTGDNCGVASVSNDAPASFPLGITVVTWTVTDINGNTNNDTQSVEVVDDQDPTIVDLPADITVSNDPGNCSAVVNWIAPTVSDNCAAPVINQTGGLASGSIFPLGTSVIEYTATDGSGNTTVETFTVTVDDNENPTITAPADVTVSAGSNCTASGVALGSPVTGDNCTIDTVTNNAPNIYPLGTSIVTWTVTDSSGNMATTTQNVTVVDDTDPVIVAPADMELTADVNCEATVGDLGTPISSDNCSVISVTDDAPAVFPLGVTTVTWTATDGSGNTSIDTQDITVVDETDPTIVDLPTDTIVSNDIGNCDAVVTWVAPTVNDNCSGATITQTAGPVSGSAFPVGVTTIEYTATDGSGNEVIGSFTVTVNDDENPTIVAAADTLIEANNFCTAINIVLDAPTVGDNCTVSSVDNDAPVIYPLGNTIVTWTVTDSAGNTSIDTQIVTVADSTAPTIIAPLPVTAYVDDSCEVSTIDLGVPTTSDNCAVDTVYNNAPAVYTTGSYTITWAAEDASGNVSFATQEVTVIDTILPVANLTDTTITLSPDGPITVLGSDIDVGSTDNCGVSEVVLMQEVFDCDDLGVNQIAVEVIDVHGNVLQTFITVTVEESGIDLDFDHIDDACDDDVNTTVVVVPSGFTPNGDGINDLFVITALDNYTTVELMIYNRYGNLVYESGQYENNWDGTSSKNGMELPDGTYFYILELDGGERQNGYVHINRTL